MKPSRSTQHSLPHIADFSLGEDVDLVIGLTAAALAGNEVAKLARGHQHQGSHLVKAGLSAAVAASALNMMRREHQDHHRHHNNDRSREHTRHYHSQRTDEGDERHHHEHHGPFAQHSQPEYPRDSEHHSDYSGQSLENRTRRHHHDRPESIHALSSLSVEHGNHNYDGGLGGTDMSVPFQKPEYGCEMCHRHASARATTALDRLAPPADVSRHHVHFSDDYDQDGSRNSR